MPTNCNPYIIRRCKQCNCLYITIKNNSFISDSLILNIYDYSDCEKKLVYSKKFYLTSHSTKTIYFPLISKNYDDCINIEYYEVTYCADTDLLSVSFKEILTSDLDD